MELENSHNIFLAICEDLPFTVKTRSSQGRRHAQPLALKHVEQRSNQRLKTLIS